jgi:phosphoglycolate phosphatase-like HAD superfamily hydrolase
VDPKPAAIVDVDGTLVDSNYQHVVAWEEAFRANDVFVPNWVIHRHVGMGGDQLVEAVAGDDVERDRGDRIRDGHTEAFEPFLKEIEAFPDARHFLEELKRRGHSVALATSAKGNELERYLELLGAEDLVDGWTKAEDVERTKPHPDLLHHAMDIVGEEGVLIGDSRFDAEAAKRARVPMIGLLTGGFGEEELLDAGAVSVSSSLEQLLSAYDDTPLNPTRASR